MLLGPIISRLFTCSNAEKKIKKVALVLSLWYAAAQLDTNPQPRDVEASVLSLCYSHHFLFHWYLVVKLINDWIKKFDQFDNLTMWQFENLSICQYINLTIWQIDNWTIGQFDNLTIWQFDNLTIWQFDSHNSQILEIVRLVKSIATTRAILRSISWGISIGIQQFLDWACAPPKYP